MHTFGNCPVVGKKTFRAKDQDNWDHPIYNLQLKEPSVMRTQTNNDGEVEVVHREEQLEVRAANSFHGTGHQYQHKSDHEPSCHC